MAARCPKCDYHLEMENGEFVCLVCSRAAALEALEEAQGALKECQRLAIERIQTADAAVKKDVYAADALMGIATVSRRALDRILRGTKEDK